LSSLNRRCRMLFVALVGSSFAFALTILLTHSTSSLNSTDVRTEQANQVAPPVPPVIQPAWWGQMCSLVVTGTEGGTYVITGESGTLVGIQDYKAGPFEQKVLSRTDTRVEVRVTSRGFFDTDALFPLNESQLPSDVREYLEPTSTQQSDDPAIVAQAEALVEDARLEIQAVDAILNWVRANIVYDYDMVRTVDAVSIYEARAAVCSGFSNLSVALLRAVGIPARYRSGCALWSLPHGGAHAWIEVYYPDVGWVPTEPQSTINITGKHLVDFKWGWCTNPQTTITYTEQTGLEAMYALETPYSDDIWPSISSAKVSSWNRHPARVSVGQIGFMIADEEKGKTLSRALEVESVHCYTTSWGIDSGVGWVTVSPSEGVEREEVLVEIDTSSLQMGENVAKITISTPEGSPTYFSSPREIPIRVWVVDEVHSVYLPATMRNSPGD